MHRTDPQHVMHLLAQHPRAGIRPSAEGDSTANLQTDVKHSLLCAAVSRKATLVRLYGPPAIRAAAATAASGTSQSCALRGADE